MQANQTRINRYKLMLLLGIPFIMMAGAYFVYFTGVGIPASTANKGILIDPPLQIGSLPSLRPQLFPAAENRHWLFIIPGSMNCASDCRRMLYLTRQLRIALGKYTHRIQRIYLNLSAADTGLSKELQQLLAAEHADLKVVDAERQDFASLVQTAPTPPVSPEDVFYIADPRGFIMLYYSAEHSGKDVLADFKFLLKFSPE